MFKKASKKQSFLRMAVMGPAGSGKTYSTIKIGDIFAKREGTQMAVIDTERGSACKYADLFEFDVVELSSFSPQKYIEAIKAAQQGGYGVLVIDSLSHAWTGKDGALELVDKEAQKSTSKNSFAAWRHVTPLHNELVDTILRFPGHVFVSMRVKTEYVNEKDERTGRMAPKKIGLAPIQRDGVEYEFDIVADMNADNYMHISKSRCPDITNEVYHKPAENIADPIYKWLRTGEDISVEQKRILDFDQMATENAKQQTEIYNKEIIKESFGNDDIPEFKEPVAKKKHVELPEIIPELIEYIPEIICESVKELKIYKECRIEKMAAPELAKLYDIFTNLKTTAKTATNKQWFSRLKDTVEANLMRLELGEPFKESA